MAKNKPVYLYRSVYKSLVEQYKNDPSQIPNLEGRNFTQYSRLNPYPYKKDKRYMHFFDSRVYAKQYAENTELETGKETCVLVFKFDPAVIDSCRTRGKFITRRSIVADGEEYIELNEYIIPAEEYVPAVNFVGVLEKDTGKPEPNVYAVLPESEVEYYATNPAAANGLEYQKEKAVAAQLAPESLKYKEKAVHLFASKKQAEAYKKSLAGSDERYELVPFSIDKSVLDCCFAFSSGLGVSASTPADKEYLMPISEMKTDYYYESSNESQANKFRYDPDDYSSNWFF